MLCVVCLENKRMTEKERKVKRERCLSMEDLLLDDVGQMIVDKLFLLFCANVGDRSKLLEWDRIVSMELFQSLDLLLSVPCHRHRHQTGEDKDTTNENAP